jgi:hypothetical protein
MDVKKPPPNTLECANCTVPGEHLGITLRPCSRCKLVRYCGTECQTQHWKASHKKFCVAVDKRKPELAAKNYAMRTKCVICLGSMESKDSCQLPCSHIFHQRCIDGIRANSTAQVCPLCRADLAGPDAGEPTIQGTSKFKVRANVKSKSIYFFFSQSKSECYN